MDVESVHSANSHRSHSKNINGNDLVSRQFSNFDTHSYPRPMNPGGGASINSFPAYQFSNNAMPIFHPPYYTYNPALINNNFVFNPNQAPNNAGYVPAAILQNNGYGDCYGGQQPMAEFGDSEKIQVQIVPQDDNWGADTCTAVTSDTGGSADNFGALDNSGNHWAGVRPAWNCLGVLGNTVFVLLCALCLGSPIAMVTMPQLPWLHWTVSGCGPACEAQLIALAAKMLILIIGTVALHCRHRQFALTRVSLFRAFVLALALVIVFSYWLFFAVRILDKRHTDMHSIVSFAASLVDSLLFVHYLALILLEIRQLQLVFYVKVTRSPDGATRFYRLGRQSLQSAAVLVLQNYVTDFQDYNYDLVQCLRRKCHKRYQSKHTNSAADTPDKKTKYKVYSIDPGVTDHPKQDSLPATNADQSLSPGIKIGTGTSARLYEESEWEKKFRKRQMRLLVAVEEAFSHVQPMEEANAATTVVDDIKNMASLEAAQTILPAIMKPLQKLLRVSRRHLSYSSGIVIDHIAHCLAYKLSPKYLVQQFSPNLTVMDSLLLSGAKAGGPADKPQSQIYLSWTVICDRLLSKGLEDGVSFQLKPRDCKVEQLSLMCTVHKVPFFSLEEKPFIESQCRFVLHSNSETSV